ADALGGDGEEDQVGAVEVLLLSAEERHPQVAWQLHPVEVTLVLTRPRQLLGLLARAAQEPGPDPGALEQDGDGRAERPGPDDRGPTRILARVAHRAARYRR